MLDVSFNTQKVHAVPCSLLSPLKIRVFGGKIDCYINVMANYPKKFKNVSTEKLEINAENIR